MAYSKVIFNGTTLIDLTDDTVAANKMLSGIVATDNSGTEVTGNIATITSSDVTISDGVVTVPVGYVATEIEKSIGQTVSPVFKGGALSGSGTLSGSGCSISSSTNNSGISISGSCSVTRANVVYDGAVAGIVTKNDGDVALAGGSDSISISSYYINGVTLTAPSSGTRSFDITVPNGNGTITFTFTVDSSGNVVVTEGSV